MSGQHNRLLAQPDPSTDTLGQEEEDALLTGQPIHRESSDRWKMVRELALFGWAVIATALVIVLAVLYHHQLVRSAPSPDQSGKRNLVFMVSDGMGPTSLSLTRSYKQLVEGLPYSAQLVLDTRLIGQSRTRSTSSLVTDSAAGATAFSCGFKSYNGAIATLPDQSPCGTVLEAAKRAGYMTGLVVTTRITDATPACFASHVHVREEEDRIAEQLAGYGPLGRVVDLMIGGGRCHFLPNTTDGSCRADEKDVVGMAKKNGFSYIHDRAGFHGLKGGDAVKFPLLGLLADTDIPYEIDRRFENHIYPSLDEMANVALNALSRATKESEKGFFLMIEGSRIDHAGHANDPATQAHEVLAYDKAVASVLEFLQKETVPGVMVSTSDHETGGLATTKQIHSTYPDYLWYPEVLANVSNSAERLSHTYHEYIRAHPNKDSTKFVGKMVTEKLGILDATEDEIVGLVDYPENALYQFADMVSRRSQNGWTTHGHSAADVNVYANSPASAAPLVGNHENTEIGNFLRDYLDLDLDSITEELKSKGALLDQAGAAAHGGVGWMGPKPKPQQRLDGQDHLDHYQLDFWKHKRCDLCG